eukprot:INCI15063.1.p1 GENE.INCI15063.1~~INCI15063.1.p1  ORF type:complete len:500 (+),score=72.25 INCI15063.1:368-1867(+)
MVCAKLVVRSGLKILGSCNFTRRVLCVVTLKRRAVRISQHSPASMSEASAYSSRSDPGHSLPRHGYGLHIENPAAFPLRLNTTVLGGSDSTDSESDDDLVIRASSQPVVCATCREPCAGGGPGSSSLSQCNYCERAFHSGCVHGLGDASARTKYQSWACPFCAQKAIDEKGVRVVVNRLGHYIPAQQLQAPAPTVSRSIETAPKKAAKKKATPKAKDAGPRKRKATEPETKKKKKKKKSQTAKSKAAAKPKSKGKTKVKKKTVKRKASIDDTESESDNSMGAQLRTDEFGRQVKLITVTITKMPLGIGFDTRGGSRYLAIHHFNAGHDGAPGPAQRSGHLKIGDQLVVVGDTEVQAMKFVDVVQMLTAMPVPLRLQFLRTSPHFSSAHPCWHKYVFQAACRLGPAARFASVLTSAKKAALASKASHPKLSKKVTADLIAIQQKLASGRDCCEKSGDLLKVNVPFNSYHPHHQSTSNPSLFVTPVTTDEFLKGSSQAKKE